MELEVKKLVYDLDQAIDLIIDFTAGKRWADYQAASVFSAFQRFSDSILSPNPNTRGFLLCIDLLPYSVHT